MIEAGPMPGDPTPEEIAERCEEVHEFRRLGVPIPEVTVGLKSYQNNRRTNRRVGRKRHRRSRRESVIDSLLEGVPSERIAKALKLSVDEVEDYANEIEFLADNVSCYRCVRCGYLVTTNPCILCTLSAMAVA